MSMMIVLLLAAHFVCDYPLQGDFLAKAKAQGPLRLWHLFGHSMIHGGAVALVTGWATLGILETICHMLIDELKVRGITSFATDQALHMVCKAAWIVIVLGNLTYCSNP